MAMAMAMVKSTQERLVVKGKDRTIAGTLGSRWTYLSRASVAAGTITLALGAGYDRFAASSPEAIFRKSTDVVLLKSFYEQAVVDGVSDAKAQLKWRRLAKAIIRQKPLSASGMRLLAFSGNGSHLCCSGLIRLSSRVSRRDLGTHLWNIENSVSKQDVVGALHHYDLALLTSNDDARKLLFSKLVSALGDPKIDEALQLYIRHNSNWLVPFVEFALVDGSVSLPLAELVRKSGGFTESPKFEELNARLLDQLVATGHYEAARTFYLSLSGAEATRLTSLSLDSKFLRQPFGSLDWRLNEAASFGANFSGSGNSQNTLAIFANSGSRGVVASKVLFLSPGTYALSVRLGPGQLPHQAALRWSLSCLSPSKAGTVWSLEKGQQGIQTEIRALIDVLDTCAFQRFELSIIDGAGQTGSFAEIISMELRPNRN